MAASHLKILLCELEGIEEMDMAPTTKQTNKQTNSRIIRFN